MEADKLVELVNVVRQNKGLLPLTAIPRSMRLREDLGFDSLDLAELTARIYEKHHVDVFAEGIVSTVGEIEYRMRRTRQRRAPAS